MMQPVLIVPAAGLGTRLQAPLPKLLVAVAGVPMIDRVLALYRPFISRAVIVVHPVSAEAVRNHLATQPDVELVVQPEPTGMLDAILLATDAAARVVASSVWITWCDQVALHPRTVERLARLTTDHPAAAIVMPTVRRTEPYIHFERDHTGRINRVLQRREGDAMPAEGESDVGLFALSSEAFFALLPAYAEAVPRGQASGERNFLPFIPWVAHRGSVLTFPNEHLLESVGVNTPEELRQVEEYLSSRGE